MTTQRKEEGMSTAKEEVRKLLDQLPDEASFEDIQYHIYVREKIERGLKDVKEGRVFTQAEVEEKMSKWLGE
jgi:predicted transcriptional regulator